MDATTGDIPFEALLKHRAWVRALAGRLVGDPSLADDLEQQTWMAALRRPPVRALAVLDLEDVYREVILLRFFEGLKPVGSLTVGTTKAETIHFTIMER